MEEFYLNNISKQLRASWVPRRYMYSVRELKNMDFRTVDDASSSNKGGGGGLSGRG